MERFRKIGSVCRACWLQLLTEGRFYCILLLVAIALFYMTDGICAYAAAHQYALSPWLFPFISDNREARLILFSIALLLICDIGNEKDTYLYQILRCGRMNYILGKVFYLLSLCFFFTMFIAVGVAVLRLPYIKFDTGWGKVLHSFSSTLQNTTQGIMGSDYITDQLTAFQGMFYAVFLFGAVLFLMGMAMYVLSVMEVHQFAQMGVGCVMIALDYAANSMSHDFPVLNYISPLTWSNLVRLKFHEFANKPDYRLAFVLAIGISVVLVIVCMIRVKRFYQHKV